MAAVTHQNELCSHAYAISCEPDAARENMRHTKLPSNLLNRLGSGFVLHRRSSRNHTQPLGIQSNKMGDHFIGQPITEIVVPLTAAKVFKRQYHQHRFTRYSRGGISP